MEQRIGSYQVLEEIASGGQATVYRVWDTLTGRILALKVMHPHLSRDATYLERFHREARLAASINHPNVVRIHEVGQEGDKHYMALEYLPLTLHHLIQAQARMPLERVVDIARQVALGLEAAREQGIIHRDIKPQNILIGPEGTAKVTDFGISRAADLSTMTRTGMIMGTPHYMSPEQAKGLRVDIRSDVYSLGVVMYQMLTGELPFEAETPWEVIRRHIEVQPRPVRQLRPDTPRPVEQVVTRCLEKEPDRRYQTPVELARALERALPSFTPQRPQPRPQPAPPTSPASQGVAAGVAPPAVRPASPQQVSGPAAPAQQGPSTTWMSSWAFGAWRRTQGNRWAMFGTVLALVVSLAITGVALITNGIRDSADSGAGPGGTGQGIVPESVVFPDGNLEAAIREALDKPPQHEISAADLVGLTGLDAPKRGIVDLGGLENAVNLTTLYLNGNDISDISPLSSLTKLTTLFLEPNQISDLSPLASLTNLTDLRLARNQISDLSPLAGLSNLHILFLGGNQISDISPLASLTSLSWLYLFNNQISDISPLASLTSLGGLFLPGNQISDISPLASLTDLTWVYLVGNQISDLSPLASLANLSALYLYDNQISGITPLVENTGLGDGDEVWLQNNNLDLSEGSEDLENIRQLQARGVEVHYE